MGTYWDRGSDPLGTYWDRGSDPPVPVGPLDFSAIVSERDDQHPSKLSNYHSFSLNSNDLSRADSEL